MNNKYFEEQISKLKFSSNYRKFRDLGYDGKFVIADGQKLLNFSSNDYLGINSRGVYLKDFQTVRSEASFSSVSSRSLTGNSKEAVELENSLSFEYKRNTLLFNSGYHANTGVIPAIAKRNDLIIADKLVHASIIDGINLSTAEVKRFKHNDLNHLEYILNRYIDKYNSVIVITESIFSMDGDLADLSSLVELKRKFGFLLYVDEAHAVGVRGERGLGLAEETNTIFDIDFIVGTFGKAFASYGAFVVCSELIYNYLVNNVRTLIFSTMLPPAQLEWTNFVFSKLLKMNTERELLKDLSVYFRYGLAQIGFSSESQSQIIPLLVGENQKVMTLAAKISQKGYLALPVRPPSVPPNTARLRFSLSAAMTKLDIRKLISEIEYLV